MSEMIERVARALAKADGKDPDAPAWARFSGGACYQEGICWRDQYSAKARAALEAMRRPTAVMASEGMHCLSELPAESGWDALAIEAQHIWLVMLNAALCDTDRSGEAGQTAKQAGPVGREPGPNVDSASPNDWRRGRQDSEGAGE